MALADPLDVKRTQQPTGKDGKILVVVQLSGGNDGLNTVIPYADDATTAPARQIRHEAKTVLKIDDYRRPAPQPHRRSKSSTTPAAGRRPRRRLPQPQPLPLPLDGYLAEPPAG